jgi:hypothetical protein
VAAIYLLVAVACAFAVAVLGGVIAAAPVWVGLYVVCCALSSWITLVWADLLGLRRLGGSLPSMAGLSGFDAATRFIHVCAN